MDEDDETLVRHRRVPIPRVFFWETVKTALFLLLLLGICAGASAFWLYVMRWF